MNCSSLRLIWLIALTTDMLVLLYAGIRLDAFRKPDRSPFARFPNGLRREDYEDSGQRWYTLGIRLFIIAAAIIGALAPIEFLCPSPTELGAATQTLTMRGGLPEQ